MSQQVQKINRVWKIVNVSAGPKNKQEFYQKSETRITASVLKQNPNTLKGSKERDLLGQNTICTFLG